VSAPTSRPSRAPTRTPTFFPTSEPTGTPFAPPSTRPAEIPETLTPVSVRSLPPVSSSTTVPDAASPTAKPTFAPTPTPNRDPSGPSSESSCETAFVYCPGYSTCFLDDGFNSGRGIVASNPGKSWGWNIEYICGGPLHCEIWMGSQDCSFQRGRTVGIFYFDEHVATYYLFTGYQSNEFNFYAGQCEGNDGGELPSFVDCCWDFLGWEF
jgi:hypothetical protein